MPNCLCTISNDDLIKGTETLIKSFLKNNSWFSEDILVLSNNKISILSDENKAKLVLNGVMPFVEHGAEPILKEVLDKNPQIKKVFKKCQFL